MSSIPEVDVLQINRALEQHVAGRDLFNFFVPSSIKLMLATQSNEQLDQWSIDNERFFGYRFGFTATPSVRPQVIAFKNKYELLDDEIRWLKRASHLGITRTEMTVIPYHSMPISGWIFVTLLSLFCFMMSLMLVFSGIPEWQKGLGLLLIFGVCIPTVRLLDNFFLNPWEILKRSGIIGPRQKEGSPKEKESTC